MSDGFTQTQLGQLQGLFSTQFEQIDKKLETQKIEILDITQIVINTAIEKSEEKQDAKQEKRHRELLTVVENSISMAETGLTEVEIAGAQINIHDKEIKNLDKRTGKLEKVIAA